jgi:type III restriction enzyme
VFVATIQTLRVENTEGRKVYAHHEALEPLFANVPKRISGWSRSVPRWQSG